MVVVVLVRDEDVIVVVVVSRCCFEILPKLAVFPIGRSIRQFSSVKGSNEAGGDGVTLSG